MNQKTDLEKTTPNIPFCLLAETWLQSHGANLYPGTRHMYQTVIHKHLNPALGDITLDNLQPMQLQKVL